MIVAVLLAGLLQTPQASHTVSLEPTAVEVGLPFEVRALVTHPAGLRPLPLEMDLDPAAPFVLLDASRKDSPGGSLLVWRLVCLEPGETAPPDLYYSLRLDDTKRSVRVEAPALSVAGVLGEGEDEPRALLGFRDLPGEPADAGVFDPAAWALGALALGLIALGLWLYRKSLRGRHGADGPSTAARLAALRGSQLSPRALCFEVTRLLRLELDRRGGIDRRGLTDEEWARSAREDPALSPDALSATMQVLDGAAAHKYGGETPTEWALGQTFDQACVALEALEDPR